MAGLSQEELDGLRSSVHTLASASLKKGLSTPNAAKLSERIAALADRALKMTEQRGHPLACAPKCNWCCHRVVPMNVPEAAEIVQHVLQSWDSDRISALLTKLRASWEEAKPNRPRFYWNIRTPCPMLEDGLCSVYEHRPLRCRSVTSTDAVICESYVREVDFRHHLADPNKESEVVRAIGTAIQQGLQENGITTQMLPLSGILLALLENDQVLLQELSHSSQLPWEVRLDPKPGEPLGVIHPRDPALESFKEKKKIEPLDQALGSLPSRGARYALARITAPRAYRSENEIEEWEQRFGQALEEARCEPVWDAQDAYNAIPNVDPWSFCYAGLSMRKHMEKLGELFHERIAKEVAPDLLEPLPTRKSGRIKVGFISTNLYHNSGANWVQGWLKNLNKSEFETFAFKIGPREDGFSYLVQDLVDHYFMLSRSPMGGCRFVREQDLDYLIYTDLADEAVNYQYAIFRLARRQALAWGCPFTSGLRTIDDYLSSDLMELQDAQSEYTESLVRLPNTGVTYERFPQWLGPKSREELGLPNGFLATMCQNVNKWLPRHDEMLAEIVHRTGNPLLLFRFGKVQVFAERMERLGVPLLWMDMTEAQLFNRMIESCDVSLDPPDYGGGHTSFYTLQFRTPIVTMPSAYLRGRFGLAYLQLAGVPELIASSPKEYVRLATDRELLRECRERMNPDALFEDVSPVRTLEGHIGSTIA